MQNEIDLRELGRILKALPKEIASKNGGPLKSALFQAAKLLREDAKVKAPTGETGGILDGIIMKRDRNPGQINNANERYLVTVKKTERSYYAGFVHWGTDLENQGPHTRDTFMQDAWDSRQRDAFQAFQNTLVKRLNTAVRKAKRAS